MSLITITINWPTFRWLRKGSAEGRRTVSASRIPTVIYSHTNHLFIILSARLVCLTILAHLLITNPHKLLLSNAHNASVPTAVVSQSPHLRTSRCFLGAPWELLVSSLPPSCLLLAFFPHKRPRNLFSIIARRGLELTNCLPYTPE